VCVLCSAVLDRCPGEPNRTGKPDAKHLPARKPNAKDLPLLRRPNDIAHPFFADVHLEMLVRLAAKSRVQCLVRRLVGSYRGNGFVCREIGISVEPRDRSTQTDKLFRLQDANAYALFNRSRSKCANRIWKLSVRGRIVKRAIMHRTQ